MTDHQHPYINLPKQAFWKTAIADVDSTRIDLAWTPKSQITRKTRIITVGSCFAQHISRSLRENGFNWVDAEPAPAALPPMEHGKNGYGVFSFRTGNIYTAALLKQWLMWAMGKETPSTECFFDAGRHFDPFRPTLSAGEGFTSAEDMLAARRFTLAAIFDTVKKADLLIFTLGLTEAWLNKDGYVYPMCPGTIHGTFAAEDHHYHNFNEQEVVRDITKSFDALRVINPDLRFLLTVSPVPLTATASGQHVLTATTYSKSVLRSAAGFLSQNRDDTDYFPSYELITAPAFKGRFFEPNMRAVSADGVQFVMNQFLAGIEPRSKGFKTAADGLAVAENDAGEIELERDFCDDIILETWSNRPVDEIEDPPNILLIGDSQMGMIAKALDEQGIRYAGGAIMHGSEWHNLKFELNDKEPFFTPTILEAQIRWSAAFEKIKTVTPTSNSRHLWVMTNIGLHARAMFSMDGIGSYLQKVRGASIQPESRVPVTIDELRNYVNVARPLHIQLLKKFTSAGYNVLWIGDPPTDPRNSGYYDLIEGMVSEKVKAIGCESFCSAAWISDTFGNFPRAFSSTEIDSTTGEVDNIHGSPKYYQQLLREVFHRFSIPLQYRKS